MSRALVFHLVASRVIATGLTLKESRLIDKDRYLSDVGSHSHPLLPHGQLVRLPVKGQRTNPHRMGQTAQ